MLYHLGFSIEFHLGRHCLTFKLHIFKQTVDEQAFVSFNLTDDFI